MKLIKNPNLPLGKVCIAAVGCAYSAVHNALSALGIQCIQIPKHSALQPSVACHADMLMHHLDENNILVAKGELELSKRLKSMGFQCDTIEKPLSRNYPEDVLLNACRIGNLLLCNTKTISREMINYCNENGICVKHVNQGYTKCSVCIVNEKAIITADKQLAAVCRACDIDVLEIRPGHIVLEGLSYGFIGGCSGLIDKNVMAFTGDIERHPDGIGIKQFLKKHHTSYVTLLNCELMDIGGILPLAEE